jgi:hypothetical protein
MDTAKLAEIILMLTLLKEIVSKIHVLLYKNSR